jgi:hypothetical protein
VTPYSIAGGANTAGDLQVSALSPSSAAQHRSVLNDDRDYLSDKHEAFAQGSSRQSCKAILRWSDETIHTFFAARWIASLRSQ